MDLSSVPAVSGQASAFTVKVAKSQSDQYQAVMNTLLQSVAETPSPASREGHATGHVVNAVA